MLKVGNRTGTVKNSYGSDLFMIIMVCDGSGLDQLSLVWQAVGQAVIPGSLIVIRSVYDYHGRVMFRTGSAVAGVAGCGAGCHPWFTYNYQICL
jgi:hypothetical protein